MQLELELEVVEGRKLPRSSLCLSSTSCSPFPVQHVCFYSMRPDLGRINWRITGKYPIVRFLDLQKPYIKCRVVMRTSISPAKCVGESIPLYI
jgi:hypothetical protein